MLHAGLDRQTGVLHLRPEGKLGADDFKGLAALVDPWIRKKGALRGILLEAPAFPGWDSFGALVSHLKFVKAHHRKVRRIAVVSDSAFLAAAPKVAKHFVGADLKSFDAGARDSALAWLLAD